MELLIAAAVGFLLGYASAIPTWPWIHRKIATPNGHTGEIRTEFKAAVSTMRLRNPRIDYDRGVDNGIGYGTRSGMG